MKILMIGDTYGDPGRKAVEAFVPAMRKNGEADFVVCNGENAAGGAGLTESVCKELFQNGCDAITGGDHFFDKRDKLEDYLKRENPPVIRPANFSKELPGRGSCIVECQGVKIGILHLAGQVFMRYHFTSPFPIADEEVDRLKKQGAQIILVDMHAEATSEKAAMGWYLDGRVSAVVGSHTHVQTADEKVTQKGTAFLSDLGLTGPHLSIIGADKDLIMPRFLTQVGGKKEVASGDIRLCGALIDVDHLTGKARSITRVQKKLGN